LSDFGHLVPPFGADTAPLSRPCSCGLWKEARPAFCRRTC